MTWGNLLKQSSAQTTPPPADSRPAATYPSIARRLAAMAYEALLVAAIAMGAAFLFVGAATDELHGLARLVFQLYLLLIVGGYFVWCWRRGRTLAMKAWKLRVVRVDGTPLHISQALLRFVYAALTLGTGLVGAVALWKAPAAPGWLALGLGVFDLAWAVFDPDKQFLHDRLARTRLVLVKPPPKPRKSEN